MLSTLTVKSQVSPIYCSVHLGCQGCSFDLRLFLLNLSYEVCKFQALLIAVTLKISRIMMFPVLVLPLWRTYCRPKLEK